MATTTVQLKQCAFCTTPPTTMDVDEDAYKRWMHSTTIQVAFPNMSADDRELLMTGIHPACWDKAFMEDVEAVEDDVAEDW